MKRPTATLLVLGVAGLTALAWLQDTSLGGAASLGLSPRRLASAEPAAQADPLACSVKFEEDTCAPLPNNCACKNFRRQGKRCLFYVLYDGNGTAVPQGRLYAATLDCGECANIDPPAPNEKAGEVVLHGPRQPDIARSLAQPYDELISSVRKFRREFEGKTNIDFAAAAKAEQDMARIKRQIAEILSDRCVGFYYRAVPGDKRIPLSSFVFSLDTASDDGAAMETDIQIGAARLIVYSDCFYNLDALKPTPEVFCAALLHEIYHWQQENYGGGSSKLEHIIYELACTEKMRLDPFYVMMLGPDRATREFYAPQRDYWLSRFEKEWASLDRAGRKKVAGWAWSRGGTEDETPEDEFMRELMFFRNGWLASFWETLFKATELRIFRLPASPWPGLLR